MKAQSSRLALAIPFLFAIFFSSATGSAETVPRFEDYPAGEVFRGENAAPRLTTTEARRFATRLREAAAQKPNFAGRFILTQWGCGSGCIMPAIIDAKTGQVTMVPFTVTTVGEQVIAPLEFTLQSSLLIVHGSRNDADENGTFYYKWQGNNLELIH